MKIRIGSRGSKLALIQTEYVKRRLEEYYPEHEYEIVIVKTKGDRIQDKPLNQIGGKGLFVKEIEEQILSGELSMGVHSMKDMPARPARGLVFSRMWKRENPADVLVLREKHSLNELAAGSVIGTGSERRKKQLRKLRPDLRFTDIRGNIDTRLKKMEEQKLDGIVLAAAGLKRLGLEERITCYLSPEEMIPAPAQGILALEVRVDEKKLLSMLDALSEEETHLAGTAERIFLEEMGGNCHVPVGACCKVSEGETAAGKKLRLSAVYGREGEEELFYAEEEGDDPKQLALAAAKSIRRQMAGTVFLTGAGPGDAGLITVRGMKAVREADCILYDRLAAPEILSCAPADCELIYAGKENHHHTMKQEEINRLLAEKAMQYRRVVRLKGGDVYVFGRGGEEALYLKEKGISCEVIPGVSSCTAGPAYAGIPITHRGTADGFHVVTAHNKQDELADIDFEGMAHGDDTCIFLMGLSKLGEIAERLMAAGMKETTCAAVISCAARPEQKTVISDIKHIKEETEQAGIKSPALIVVGKVVALREQLNFFEEKPLFGRKYLVPKIGRQTSSLAELLREQGAAAREIQVGEIRWKEAGGIKERMQADYLIFTSKNGVEGFFRLLLSQGMDARSLSGKKIAVIGQETGNTLKKYGVLYDVMPDRADSISLCEKLREAIKGEEKKPRVLYPGAQGTEHFIREGLKDICDLTELPVYENVPVEIAKEDLRECEEGEYDGIFFTCASSAERIWKALGGKMPERTKVISIGRKCSDRLKRLGITEYTQAQNASYKAMAETVIKFI